MEVPTTVLFHHLSNTYCSACQKVRKVRIPLHKDANSSWEDSPDMTVSAKIH